MNQSFRNNKKERETGLEPAASWSRTKHATKLRYTPTTQETFYRIQHELSRADLENPAGFP